MNHGTSTNCLFPVTDNNDIKSKMLNWANQFSIFCLLDNHNYAIPPHQVDCLLAAGSIRSVESSPGKSLANLQQFIDQEKSWLFGHLSYDLKNEIEVLTSSNPDHIGFPDLFFFEPEIVLRLDSKGLKIEKGKDPEKIFNDIAGSNRADYNSFAVSIEPRMSREEYINTIEELRSHILRGDCYEINYCQEFFANHAHIDPITVYGQLCDLSPNPFSALYKLNEKWLICSSPERFLIKTKDKIISQPIKGTSKRYPEDKLRDAESRNALFNSSKDRSENVMVVDLVRNDLSKVCEEGSVSVEELYGIYSFPQVHQMISTISGRVRKDSSFTDIIRACFPMGSMTGAPKKRVMELVEKYERTKRGLFSGSVGYITPDGDFDLNVVIRSIMYNEREKYISYQVGSGITYYSDAASEWEECMIKAMAMRRVITGKTD